MTAIYLRLGGGGPHAPRDLGHGTAMVIGHPLLKQAIRAGLAESASRKAVGQAPELLSDLGFIWRANARLELEPGIPSLNRRPMVGPDWPGWWRRSGLSRACSISTPVPRNSSQ